MRHLNRSICFAPVLFVALSASANKLLSVDQYPTIQAALDQNPGQQILVPAGDYHTSSTIVLQTDGAGLYGPGTIIQDNPKEEILRVQKGKGIRVKDITLTRPTGAQDCKEAGLHAVGCEGLEVDGVHVIDNRSGSGAVRFEKLRNSTIRNCTIQNYKTFAIDDRTHSPTMGYAFKCIDGTGIVVFESVGTQILNNRILEYNLLPTKENHDKYDLGAVTVMPKEKGILTPDEIFATKHTNNWHQGSGLIVSTPEKTRNTIISGNYIENAAQGMDIHSDYVTITNNIVTHAMIGMKAMHGAKHVLITGNQFSYTDLWGLLLQPGAASHSAQETSGTEPAKADNSDGGTIVANNIFSNFGYGEQHWNWKNSAPDIGMLNAIALLKGQLPENPPLRDVIITGNVVYDNGRDQIIVDGKPRVEPPRFRYALYIEQTQMPKPEGIVVKNNLLHPGQKGVANFKLEE